MPPTSANAAALTKKRQANLKKQRQASLNNQRQRESLLSTHASVTRNMIANQARFIQMQRLFLNVVNQSIRNLKNVNSANLPANARQQLARSITGLSAQKNKAFRLVRAYNAKKK